RYATMAEALERMREANPRLSDEQIEHLTTHAVARNEDGTWSWKFDPYLHIWPVVDFPQAAIHQLWEAVTCPVMLFYGRDSWATSPATDGRLAHFQNARLAEYDGAGHWLHHDRFEQFVTDLRGFL
ncbi:MAG TPA: alpha/beta hydrolase, partial [Novosphingobium sp.]|nr:alpha/beta hydrolase [Novosphingobium sp.]